MLANMFTQWLGNLGAELLFVPWLYWPRHLQQAIPAIFLGYLPMCLAFPKKFETTRQTNYTQVMCVIFTLLVWTWGPGGMLWMPAAAAVISRHMADMPPGIQRWAENMAQMAAESWYLPPRLGAFWAAAIFAGAGIWWLKNRTFATWVQARQANLTARTAQQRGGRTDIRTVADILPTALTYDPRQFFRKGQIFCGLDKAGKPVCVPYAAVKSAHIQAAGTTGFGKGAFIGMLVEQLLFHGEAVFWLDPKLDEWAPHVLKSAAERAKVPFAIWALGQELPQGNLFEGATAKQAVEALTAGMNLADAGSDSDYFKVKSRNRARDLVKAVWAGNPAPTIYDLAQAAMADDDLIRNAEGLVERLNELAAINSVNSGNGGAVSLPRTARDGGVVYVAGSMRDGAILALQRMLLVRLQQVIESRAASEDRRQVFVFLDEAKAWLSRPAMEMLGAIRDKGAHVCLAHQSLADLRDVPRDLDKDAVVGAVVENMGLRMLYQTKDPNTRKWLAEFSGKVVIDEELRHFERDGALVEKDTGRRTLRQAESYLFEENTWASLPKGVGIVVGPGVASPVLVCPLPTTKGKLTLTRGPMRKSEELRRLAAEQPKRLPPDDSDEGEKNGADW